VLIYLAFWLFSFFSVMPCFAFFQPRKGKNKGQKNSISMQLNLWDCIVTAFCQRRKTYSVFPLAYLDFRGIMNHTKQELAAQGEKLIDEMALI